MGEEQEEMDIVIALPHTLPGTSSLMIWVALIGPSQLGKPHSLLAGGVVGEMVQLEQSFSGLRNGPLPLDVKSEAWRSDSYFVTMRITDLKPKWTHGGQQNREDHKKNKAALSGDMRRWISFIFKPIWVGDFGLCVEYFLTRRTYWFLTILSILEVSNSTL